MLHINHASGLHHFRFLILPSSFVFCIFSIQAFNRIKRNMTMPQRPNHPSILVVDDEDSVRVSLSMHLTDEGFDVLAAADGKSAFALLRGKTFDLVILDWKLPDMSGEEILKYIKDYF